MYSYCNCSLSYTCPCANPFRNAACNTNCQRNSFNTPCGCLTNGIPCCSAILNAATSTTGSGFTIVNTIG